LKTFKEFLTEAKEPMGNYVSIDNTTELPDMKLEQHFGGSHVCDFKDQHVTLIYSKETSVPLNNIASVIKNFPVIVKANVSGVAAFDSLPKEDGSRDVKECTIVLKLKSEVLNKIHKQLKSAGLEHSYDEFSPHISLLYNLPIEEKQKAIDLISKYISKKPITVQLSGYKNNKIIKDWHEKVK
jgi:2'-5' RNA ligase